ncbi:AMP-binding protein [Lentiprolixibacter aurantiacus]|uniref:AMP-binding protein n=1 Tax=Lentiprolixibacter aurantiacus TaxID=2993939 RepID=A0AAE3ML58_9FLAO|nr:AMP-binding protein [Lentiprolixibacter aurantiacus]MCX2719448.1 AMP-binding protein [Lentiprolixibacter aurantiacus]
MNKEETLVHPAFRLNGIKYSHEALKDVAYSLIKEGEPFEQQIGDFLLDWILDTDTILVTTSGATGRPKRVFLKKEQMANSARATGEYLNLKEGDTALLCLPADYIAGKMMLVRAMVLGLSIDFEEPTSDPLWTNLKDYDFVAMVPMQVQNTLSRLDRIGTLLIGGAAVSDTLKESLQSLKCRVYETYGMTETCSHVALRKLNHLEKEQLEKGNPFKALPGILFSRDERGCLVIEAPDLCQSGQVTNDLVELLNDREFYWLGRYDNVVNSGGVKLIPEVIEDKLKAFIDEPFILGGIPDAKLGEALTLVLEAEHMPDDIQQRLDKAKKLEKYERPKKIVHLGSFPRTENGKIKRGEVLKQLLP